VKPLPYICRNRITGQIAAGLMKNVYQFTYYGAWWWDNEKEAEAAMAEDLAQLGLEGAGEWELVEVSEQRLKIMNVKLNNDPRRTIRMDDSGAITAAVREGDSPRRPPAGGSGE